MKLIIVLSFMFLSNFLIFSQDQYFTIHANNTSQFVALNDQIKKHTLVSTNTLDLYKFLENGGRKIKISNGIVNIEVADFIEKTNISSNYLLRVFKGKDQNGQSIIEEYHGNVHGIKNFFGTTTTGGKFRMTINKYGYISMSCIVNNQEVWNIHAIRNFDIKEEGYIMFNEDDLILPKEGYSCGNIQTVKRKNTRTISTRGPRTWYEQELGIASDSAMWAKHGSVAATNTHNSDVTASCEPDWSHADLHDSLTTVIIEEYVSQTHDDDPWTYHDVINPNTAINEFQAWNGFNNNPDAEKGASGNVWQGNTVGIAWVGSSGNPTTCGSHNQYMMRDLSSASQNRNIESHERGHNMGCNHVTGNYIMRSSIGNPGFTNWKAVSVSVIDASIPAANCLTIRALPLRFVTFEGINNAHRIKLIWEVSEEIDNDYFELEKINASGDFQKLDRINAQSSISYENIYSYNDDHPKTGQNIYRLKQVDLSGTISFSNVISINYDHPFKDEIILAPNPVIDELLLIINQGDIEANWTIYNIQGQVMFHKVLKKNKEIHKIDLRKLESGIYFMQIIQGEHKTQKIFVKD